MRCGRGRRERMYLHKCRTPAGARFRTGLRTGSLHLGQLAPETGPCRRSTNRWPAKRNPLSLFWGERVDRSPSAAQPGVPGHCLLHTRFYTASPAARPSRVGPRACRVSPLISSLQRVVSAAQTPSVRRVELGVGGLLPFLLVVREHAVLRRSLCATLTALIDPFAAPFGAIADGLSPCPVPWAEVMRVGLLGLRLDHPGVQGRYPDAERVQVRHRSRCFVRRDLRKAHCARPFEGSR
jgi:hypothetical protein